MTRKKETKLIKNLQLAMLEAGLNQTKLAKKLGLSVNSVSQWLSGKANPKISTLEDIAKITGKPVNYFFANSNNNTIGNNNSPSVQNIEIELMKKDIIILKKEVEILKSRIKK